MKYWIKIHDSWCDDPPIKPHPDAILESVDYYDRRCVKTFAEGRRYPWFESWISSGREHKEDGDTIVRTILASPIWTLELDSPLDLLKGLPLRRFQRLIIGRSSYVGIPYYLEVEYLYDGT